MSNFRKDGFTPIDSTHMEAVKYDSMERKMSIKFKNGYQYDVHGVLPEDHQAFLDAPSQGEHFHNFIRDRYPVERVK